MAGLRRGRIKTKEFFSKLRGVHDTSLSRNALEVHRNKARIYSQ